MYVYSLAYGSCLTAPQPNKTAQTSSCHMVLSGLRDAGCCCCWPATLCASLEADVPWAFGFLSFLFFPSIFDCELRIRAANCICNRFHFIAYFAAPHTDSRLPACLLAGLPACLTGCLSARDSFNSTLSFQSNCTTDSWYVPTQLTLSLSLPLLLPLLLISSSLTNATDNRKMHSCC